MSASPASQSNGQTPNADGSQPKFMRKPRVVDPTLPRKKPVRRPNLAPGVSAPKSSGPPPVGPSAPASFSNGPAAQVSGPFGRIERNAYGPQAFGGWTHPPREGAQDFPLVTTKRALREGMRAHIARFTSKKDIDPANQTEFTRPVSLHRRDPRQPPPGKALKDEEIGDGLDSKEREKLEILKEQKEAKRMADQAQIAPTGNAASAAAAKKAAAFRNEKTTQVHRMDKTEAQKRESDLRYEEALPWHLEDADGRNTWVGNYEAALSDVHVALVMGPDQVFRMMPLEKWYKFTPKNQFKTLTIEEAEAMLGKTTKESRWAMKTQEQSRAETESQAHRKAYHGLYTVKAESASFKASGKKELQDIDELDFDGDELFQDDDEQATVEPDRDEDALEAQQRVKQDQRGANVFGEADEEELEKEFLKEFKEEEDRKKLGKGVRKALKKREKNLIYDSDSSHPYSSSSSDDDTSDDEKQKEIDKKKDEAAKLKQKEAEAKGKATPGASASSKGTNTPTGRPKNSDPRDGRKSLKRPGSPNLSDASESESARKKSKKHGTSSQPSRTSTPAPGSRPMSPAPGQLGLTNNIRKNMSGVVTSSLSQTSAARGGQLSDGEMSGSEKKHKKHKFHPNGTSGPNSRAGSPTRVGSAPGSRAGSPTVAQSPTLGPITAADIRAFIESAPGKAATILEIIKAFPGRVGEKPHQTPKGVFMGLVSKSLVRSPEDQKLRLKV